MRHVQRTLEKVSGTKNRKKSGVFHYRRGKSESRPGRRPICTRTMRREDAAPRARHGADATALTIFQPSPRRWRRAIRAATAARTWRGSASSDPPLTGRFFSRRKRTVAAVETRRTGWRRMPPHFRAARDRRGGRPGRGRTGGGTRPIGALPCGSVKTCLPSLREGYPGNIIMARAPGPECSPAIFQVWRGR